MWRVGCAETSVRNYRYSLRNNSEECGSQLRRGVSLKSRTLAVRTADHNFLHAEFQAQATLTGASVTVQVRWSF